MLRRFIDYYKPHRKLFFADLFFAFLLAVCDLFYPTIGKNIINEYVPDKNLRLLLIWSAVLLGIYLLKAGFNYFVNYYGHIVGVRMQADMRRDVFRRLQKLPFSFYDENRQAASCHASPTIRWISQSLPIMGRRIYFYRWLCW